MNQELYAKVGKSARYCRSVEVRKKINLFLEVIKSGNVRATCKRYGVVPKTYYCWWNRFVESDFDIASLMPRSRRPHRSPRKTRGTKLKWIKHYRKEFRYGPERIQLYLKLNHHISIAKSTVGEVIKREGLRLRRNKKPPHNRHTKRYSLPWPGQRMQMDIKYVPRKIDGKQYFVYNAIDDCTRWRISRAYRAIGISEACDFLRFVHKVAPFMIQTVQLDNDRAFTYRLTPNCFDKRHPLESTAEELGIRLKFIPPGEKELQGKVERLHRTDDDEFFWKAPLYSFGLLEDNVYLWSIEYNEFRHHKELNWKRPIDVLQEKAITLWAILSFVANGYKPLDWPCLSVEITPKIPPFMERYLLFLEWSDINHLPVTDVSGYYNRTIGQLRICAAANDNSGIATTGRN